MTTLQLENERLRNNLITFLVETKTKQCEVSQAIGVPADTLSRFKNKQRATYLNRKSLNALDAYLTEQGYNSYVVVNNKFSNHN